jgi:adenosine kinase
MDIMLAGSVAFDYLMSFPGYFRDHLLPDQLDRISLSFLVDSLIRQRGGIAPNIAYTLAIFGIQARILAAVGEDFADYGQWLQSKGVDISEVRVIPGETTASFFVSTDRANAQIASFYPGAMAHAGELSLKNLKGKLPDLVVISPNDPGAMNRYIQECRELEIRWLYDPSQQLARLSADDVCKGIDGAFALFVNDYEFGLVQNMTDLGEDEILEKVEMLVVTRGEDGVSIVTREKRHDLPAIPPKKIADPTGVGDSFRAGFLAGYTNELAIDLCGRIGMLAATYSLEEDGPQSHSYTPAEFVDRFRTHFDDRGELDVFLKV